MVKVDDSINIYTSILLNTLMRGNYISIAILVNAIFQFVHECVYLCMYVPGYDVLKSFIYVDRHPNGPLAPRYTTKVNGYAAQEGA